MKTQKTEIPTSIPEVRAKFERDKWREINKKPVMTGKRKVKESGK